MDVIRESAHECRTKGATRAEGETRLLTAEEVAQLMGVTVRTVQRNCAQGKYPGLTVTTANGGEQYRIPLDSLPAEARNAYILDQARKDSERMLADQERYRNLNREAEWRQLQEARLCADAKRPARKVKRSFPEPLSPEEEEALWNEFKGLPDGSQRKAAENLEIIQAYDALQIVGVEPGDIDRELRARFGASGPTVWRLRERIKYRPPHLWLPLLAPKWKGRVTPAEFTEEAWEFIKESWGQQSRPKLKPIYDRAKKLAESEGWSIPSIDAVDRRIKALPRWWSTYRRYGDKALSQLYPALERDYSTLALHEMWVADGHKADLFCRWVEADGKITVGRPIVVAWEDVRSRYFLGYAVGQVESADLIRLAFKHAAENARAIPAHMLLDNGRGFASKLLTGGIPNRYRFKVKDEDIPGIFNVMGVDVHWATPGWGQSKPIEPAWRFIAERVCKRSEFQGAYCGNRPDAKPEEFDSKNAVPIEQFKAALAAEILDYNRRAHRGNAMNGRSPLEIYEELLPLTAIRRPSSQQLRLCLLAAETVKPDKKDGAFNVLGNRYWIERCADLDTSRTYVVRFDPEDASQAVSVYDGERFLFEAPIIRRSGFRNQEAAKAHIKGRKSFQKARKQQAKAAQDMHRAESWIDPETGEISPSGDLPPPKVIIPVRPDLGDTPKQDTGPPIPAREEFNRLVMNGLRNHEGPLGQEVKPHRRELPFTTVEKQKRP